MQSYVVNFIRHGMTLANSEGKYIGSQDVPLCPEGEEKLKKMKNEFGYPHAKEYYTSPLKRCIQTCKIIYPDAAAEIVDGLKECDFGEWEGKTTQELMQDSRYIDWVKTDRQSTPPGGECGSDFYKRVCSAFEELVDSLIRRGVTQASVFTHGGVMALILSTYGLPQAGFYDWMVDNGCGYSVRITPSLWMRDKVFEVFEKVPLGATGEIEGEFKNLIDNLSKA